MRLTKFQEFVLLGSTLLAIGMAAYNSDLKARYEEEVAAKFDQSAPQKEYTPEETMSLAARLNIWKNLGAPKH